MTDESEPLPPCQEIIAKSRWWDTYGARWGRGAHWPIIAGIGPARHRSVELRRKQALKKNTKKEFTMTALTVALAAGAGNRPGERNSDLPANANQQYILKNIEQSKKNPS